MPRMQSTLATTDPAPLEQTRAELERRARARRALDVRRAEHSVALFTRLHQPKFREVDHLRELDAALDRSMTEPLLIVCEAPPRHFKTTRVMNHIARKLRYQPGARCVYCTYANEIAFRRSRNVRDLASRAGVWVGAEQRTKQKFDPSRSVAFWETHNGGQFMAGGRRGQYVGEGYDFIACDDLLKDQEEALSPVAREAAWQTFRMLWARLEPGGTMLLTMQRWDDDDPIGRLKRWIDTDPDAPRAIIITLRAIEDLKVETDAQGHERITGGRPLCPWRYNLDAFRKLASALGKWFWIQYQQDTSPRGKRVFPELARFTEPEKSGAFIIISCDPGISKQEANAAAGAVVRRGKSTPDPAGIVVVWARLGRDKDGDPRVALDVVYAEDLWLEGMDLLDHLEGLQTVGYPGAPVLLEEVGAFRLLEQVGARLNQKLQITAVVPHGSKFWRAQPTARAAEHALVRVPEHGEWVAPFLRQLREFTGKAGGKDGMVDALTQAYDQAEMFFGVQASGSMSGGKSGASQKDSPW